MQGKIFEGDYKTRCKNIDSLLCVGDTFDMLKREIRLGDRHAVFYMIDGFLKGGSAGKDHGIFFVTCTGRCSGNL